MSNKVRAIGLFSGGLDSTLALLLMHRQNIDVIAVKFLIGFSRTKFRSLQFDENIINISNLEEEITKKLNVTLKTIDLSDDFLPIFHNPKYGYGKNVNPCIDCRINMLRKTKALMEEYGAKFVFTGEVLGQRPLSQNLAQLQLVEEQSELKGFLLRPLSALLLPPTIPEKEHWINRSELKGLKGRSRKLQIALAEEFGLAQYYQPAGGCMLTDPNYTKRVLDLWKYKEKALLNWDDYNLLMVGRHFRFNPTTKVIVGRNKSDNIILDAIRGSRVRLEAEQFASPITIIDGVVNQESLKFAASLTARYCDGKNTDGPVTIRIENGRDKMKIQINLNKLDYTEYQIS